ncbi:BMP family ABC transporter substrate-binding protein [Mycoplasmopsis ciconiae]|uniref:BMP family ABC transporter substrate-binding protein n=1 Tax=Mycoplasmopsis ciconiae TaxID=561067 RepID=A0ABU7MM01_9BACT|nr:BMP family ABC transporter substrate-binding protein [Mycoplasmopsis ciconiae]
MKKFKKILISTLVPAATLVTAVAAISCSPKKESGDKQENPKDETQNPSTPSTSKDTSSEQSSAKKTPKPSIYIDKNKRVAEIKESSLITPEIGMKFADKKIVLISDQGVIQDNSFNQSSWEALNLLWDQTDGYANISSIESGGQYTNAYTSALSDGKDVWVLSGFGHSSGIGKFIKENKEAMEELNPLLVFVDFKVDDLDYKNYVSLQYKVQEPAYIASRAISKLLAEKYPEVTPNKRKLLEYGGGDQKGVTDFITGFLRGMIKHNTDNPSKKVTTNSDGIPLNSGFTGETQTATITQIISINDAKVILPVAGEGTTLVAQKLQEKGESAKDVMLVGVDVDQAKSNPNYASRFATSITKNLGQSVYDIIAKFVYKVNIASLVGKEEQKNFSLGLKDNWVGLSKSSLGNEEDKNKLNAYLDQFKTEFLALNPNEASLITSDKVNASSKDAATQTVLVQELQKLVNK